MESIKGMQEERDLLETEIADIKNQLRVARSKAAATGEYADHDWFCRASAALRIKGRQFNYLNREIGQQEKKLRRERNDSWERRFITVAKRRLDPETYESIVEEAGEDL